MTDGEVTRASEVGESHVPVEVRTKELQRTPPLPAGEPAAGDVAYLPRSAEALRDVRGEYQLELVERERRWPRADSEEGDDARRDLGQREVLLGDGEAKASDALIAEVRDRVVDASTAKMEVDVVDPSVRPHRGLCGEVDHVRAEGGDWAGRDDLAVHPEPVARRCDRPERHRDEERLHAGRLSDRVGEPPGGLDADGRETIGVAMRPHRRRLVEAEE